MNPAPATMKDFFIIWLIGLIVVILLFGVQDNKNYNKQIDAITQQSVQLAQAQIYADQQLYEYDDFKRALSAVDPAYNRANNNCYDHSKALQKALEAIGIQSSIFINKGRNHAWLGVWVEATNGTFVPPDNKLQIIEVRDDKLNVVCADPVLSKVSVSTTTFPTLWKY